MATSGGHTFQITGTSVGGKVVTTKLPLPANSKIVTVNVPTSQGGRLFFFLFWGKHRAQVTVIQCRLVFPSTTIYRFLCILVSSPQTHSWGLSNASNEPNQIWLINVKQFIGPMVRMLLEKDWDCLQYIFFLNVIAARYRRPKYLEIY